jgi:hypothetical protein
MKDWAAPIFQIPADHNLVGTCGLCGGPVITPMIWGGSTASRPAAFCYHCNARAKPTIVASWGPIIEMQP